MRSGASQASLAFLALLLAVSLSASCASAPVPDGQAAAGDGRPRELVVLVHGMGRTPLATRSYRSLMRVRLRDAVADLERGPGE